MSSNSFCSGHEAVMFLFFFLGAGGGGGGSIKDSRLPSQYTKLCCPTSHDLSQKSIPSFDPRVYYRDH